MLKYKGKDSKALTVLVGLAKLAADVGKPFGWDADNDDPALNEGAHPSDQVLAIMEAFGFLEFSDPDDPLDIEFGKGAHTDMCRLLCAVRDMPEYAKVMEAGLRPDCFDSPVSVLRHIFPVKSV